MLLMQDGRGSENRMSGEEQLFVFGEDPRNGAVLVFLEQEDGFELSKLPRYPLHDERVEWRGRVHNREAVAEHRLLGEHVDVMEGQQTRRTWPRGRLIVGWLIHGRSTPPFRGVRWEPPGTARQCQVGSAVLPGPSAAGA